MVPVGVFPPSRLRDLYDMPPGQLTTGANDIKIDPPPPDILTAKEAAALLRVSLPTFYAAARRRDFPVVWVGKQARVSRRVILRMLDGGL